MSHNYNLEDTFNRVLNDINTEHSTIRKKKTQLTEHDYLLMAFMALLKAYMLKTGRNVESPITMMGA